MAALWIPRAASASFATEWTIDENDPCSAALAAISADGKTIAVLDCTTSLSGAFNVVVRFLDTTRDVEIRAMPIAEKNDDDTARTPVRRVRANVSRVRRALAAGRYHALDALENDADGIWHNARAAVSVVSETGSGQLRILGFRVAPGFRDDSSAGSPYEGPAVSRRLTPFSGMHPYCCGEDSVPCEHPADLRYAWVDTARRVLLIALVDRSGPDGCYEGTRFEVIRIAPGEGARGSVLR